MAPQGQERNEFFQKLKPWCVKISQLAIREADAPASARELREPTNQVLAILNDQIQQNPVVLDEKLAEYVFFPLYHIFRQMDKYPMTLIETCIKCLTLLIVHGWKAKLSPELAKQILTLLTFIIDGVPGSKDKREVPEEVVLESFRGLAALLATAATSATAASGFSNTDAMPALGHSVTVMLDGVVDGATAQIQQEALRALEAVFAALREHEALASFLPGTISSLAKVASTPTRYKNSVLAKCLGTVRKVLVRVLADLRTRSILVKAEKGDAEESDKEQLLSPAWLKATAAQVKQVLSTMMKLRGHESAEVRSSLGKLCVTLLDECHKTLDNCTLVLVETAIVLDDVNGVRDSLTETSLQDLVNIYPELGDKVKTTAYNWMSSFPRIMQAADEDIKQTAIHNLRKAIQLLRSLRIESSTLEDSLSGTLRDSVVALAQSSQSAPSDSGMEIQLIDDGTSLTQFQHLQHRAVLLAHESQRGIRGELMHLIELLGSDSQQSRLARSMLEQLQESTSFNQVAAFWLCFQLVKAGHAASAETDEFLDLSALTESPDDLEPVFNELYAASVQILDAHGDGSAVDWRLEATALEVTAYTAQKSGVAFRPELIDVLFPIATFLGSSNASLRAHAMVTLNSMAVSCGYADVSELIIDNVDYMVNSVSLRLNTLDISPASINVLKMMIRLAGPRLVPYLDDVVESIFASLDNYHGYPFFVESLFTVLKEVVDQGVHSDMLLLDTQRASTIHHRKKPTRVDGMKGLLDTLAKRKRREADEVIEMKAGHPKAPWKADKRNAEDEDVEGVEGTTQEDQEKPPNTPTYQLLLRVADLTQHYLTSPTPTLRRSLLELLTIASTALAPDEDSFLPLVNAIWPVVIDRLRDSEAYIAVEACHALSALCSAAGDFLSSRFKTEWHDWLRNWCRKAKRQAGSTARTKPHGEGGIGGGIEMSQILIPTRGEDGLVGRPASHMPMSVHSGGLGQFASPVRIWEAAVDLLTSIVSFVRVDEEMFDDILDLLSDVLDRNKKVGEALEAINEDAVWLARYERGSVEWLPAPQMDGVRFVEMDQAK